MTHGVTSTRRTAVDSVETAGQLLMSVGVCVMSSANLTRCLQADADAWARFSTHWEDLRRDSYAAEFGTQRLRRYGCFSFKPGDGAANAMPHRAFAQPQDSNPLYIARDRHFEPLTDAFAGDPLLHALLKLLCGLAAALDDVPEWSVEVHPFRVLGSADGGGRPTPEGLHRDGVTLVTSLLVDRRNATGGESSVFDLDGRRLSTTTLAEPGTLLLGDDRRTLHRVSPIRPADPEGPAQRDVLVITFAPLSHSEAP
ncbi:2OG-Fe dioxygenase family protein [Mycolicibacterium pyrenivorans]|uniref:2OG-Fe dioxygenase family protein n=1 Tax=Mycolicibacterium pyrenivorans TaxID=187102 RepID=UPI0021F26A4C|nr:2OG-Fe dioxygenase family protein [Mycolicibacterium pyrenivorans]MCV7152434.1 2OG-Fe dioxygenase family protein [Mycolicibacterium pyrenivorans]